MGNAIEQYLQPGEQLNYRSRPSWKTLGRAVLWALVTILCLVALSPILVFLLGPGALQGFLVAGSAIAAAATLVPAILCYRTIVGITDRRLIYRSGSDFKEIDLSQIEAARCLGTSPGQTVVVVGRDGQQTPLSNLHKPLEVIEGLQKFANVGGEPRSATQSPVRVKVGATALIVLSMCGMFAGIVTFLMAHPWLRDLTVGTNHAAFNVANFLLYALILLIGLQVFLWLGAYVGGFVALTLVRPFLSLEEARRMVTVKLAPQASPLVRKLATGILSPFNRFAGWLYGAPSQP